MNKLSRKVASVGLALTTVAWLSGATMFLPIASAQNVADLQAQITALLAQINALQSQLGSPKSSAPSYTFTRDLTVGSRGDDVKALQQWLNAKGYTIAASGVGSAGKESTYFGNATKAALAKYQKTAGVSATGYFGPKTRAAVAAAGGTPTQSTDGSVVPPVSGASLQVEPAGPGTMTIPDGSIYNNLLKLKFTAGSSDASITGLIVTRGGFIANTNVTGISAWDDAGNRYGNIITALTSDGQATLSFGNKPFMLKAGETKYLTLAANLDASTGSGSVNFSVVKASDISVSGGLTVQGTFPVTGNMMTIVDGANSLGDLYADDQSVAGIAWEPTSATGNLEIGETAREVFKLRLTQNNSKEAVRVERIVLYVEGTLQESTDLANWTLYSPEGSVLATADKSYDRYITFRLATPYVIDKGLNKDFVVKVDIKDGSNRYFRVYVQNNYDILARGVTTGAGVLPLDGSGGSLTAADTQNSNGAFKMKQGSLTVSRSSTSPSGSIAPSAQNVVLGRFDLKAAGEKLEVQKMYISLYHPTSTVYLTGTVSVRDASTGETYLSISADTSGLQATSSPVTTADLSSQNLSSYFAIESGQTKTLEVVGSVSSNATSSSAYTAYVGGFYVKRFSTNDYTTTPATTAAATGGNQISVQNVSLTITKSTGFPNTNRSKGSIAVKVGEYTLQASAADDIRINSLNFSFTSSTYIQNVKLMDGSNQLGSTIGTPSATGNVFTTNLTISKNQTKSLALFADILSSADSNNFVTSSLADSGVSGYGVASGKTLSSTPSPSVVGQTITVKTPTLTIDHDPASQVSRVYLTGSTGVELGKIRFEAKNENLTLEQVRLQFTAAVATSTTTYWDTTTDVQQRFARVYLYDGSTLLNAGGTQPQSGEVLISGLLVSLPQDTQKSLTVKADLTNDSGFTTSTNGSATDGRPVVGGIQVKSTTYPDDLKVNSQSSGYLSSGVTLTANASSSLFLIHVAAPTISSVCSTYSCGSSLGGANDVVAAFRITNPSTRPVTITNVSTTAVLSSGGYTSSTVTNFRLFRSDGTTQVVAGSIAGGVALSATSTSVKVGFASISSADGEIAAGSSRDFIVKADGTGIRNGTAGTTAPKMTVSIEGSIGADSTDVIAGVITTVPAGEVYWKSGDVRYQYTLSNSNQLLGMSASDSYPVAGTTITY